MNRETIDFVIVEDLPTLVWTANLASLELHVPQWKVGPRGGVQEPDLLVLDLDPGPPATIVECCAVALLLKEILEEDGLTGYAKTSGSKGMQLYAPLRPTLPTTPGSLCTVTRPPARKATARPRGLRHDQGTAAWQGAGRLEPERCR